MRVYYVTLHHNGNPVGDWNDKPVDARSPKEAAKAAPSLVGAVVRVTSDHSYRTRFYGATGYEPADATAFYARHLTVFGGDGGPYKVGDTVGVYHHAGVGPGVVRAILPTPRDAVRVAFGGSDTATHHGPPTAFYWVADGE